MDAKTCSGVAGNGGRVGVLFVKCQDPAVAAVFDHAEFRGVPSRHRNGGDGDCGALLLVVLHHAGDVHAVDVIGAEDRHHVRVGLLDQVDVLIDGVGRSLIPGLVRPSASAPAPE